MTIGRVSKAAEPATGLFWAFAVVSLRFIERPFMLEGAVQPSPVLHRQTTRIFRSCAGQSQSSGRCSPTSPVQPVRPGTSNQR